MNWRWAGFELAALAVLSSVLPDALGVAYVDARLRLAYAGVAAVVSSSFVLQCPRSGAVDSRRWGVWAGVGAFLFLIAADTLRVGRASNWVFLGLDAGPLAGLFLFALSLANLGAAGAAWAAGRLGPRAAAAVWLCYLALCTALMYGAPPRLHFILLSMTQPASGLFGVLLAVVFLLMVASGALAAHGASRSGTPA